MHVHIFICTLYHFIGTLYHFIGLLYHFLCILYFSSPYNMYNYHFYLDCYMHFIHSVTYACVFVVVYHVYT